MVVVRYDRSGKLQDSTPCLDCLNLIKLFNIKYIVYSNANGHIVRSKVSEIGSVIGNYRSRGMINLNVKCNWHVKS